MLSDSHLAGCRWSLQVNSEHLFKVHHQLHQQIDLFLCKTHFCRVLMQQYIKKHALNSKVWYVGHTSSDVLVEDPQQQQKQKLGSSAQLPTAAASSVGGGVLGALQGPLHPAPQQAEQLHGPKFAADYSQFLHVKGKSGLKHTRQLLECWAKHPEFPLLTVIGVHSTEDEHTRAVMTSHNVLLLPHPQRDQLKQEDVQAMAQRLAVAAAAADSAAQQAAAAAAWEQTAAAEAEQEAAAAAEAAQQAGPDASQQQKAARLAAAEKTAADAAAAKARAADADAAAQTAAVQAAAAKAEMGQAVPPTANSTDGAALGGSPGRTVDRVPAQTLASAAASTDFQLLPHMQAKLGPSSSSDQLPRAGPTEPTGGSFQHQAAAAGTTVGMQQQEIRQQQQQQHQQRLSSNAVAVGEVSASNQEETMVAHHGSNSSAVRKLQAPERNRTEQAHDPDVGAQHQLAAAAAAALGLDVGQLPLSILKWSGTPSALQRESLLSFDDIRNLQANLGVHICPSEREGFGGFKWLELIRGSEELITVDACLG